MKHKVYLSYSQGDQEGPEAEEHRMKDLNSMTNAEYERFLAAFKEEKKAMEEQQARLKELFSTEPIIKREGNA